MVLEELVPWGGILVGGSSDRDEEQWKSSMDGGFALRQCWCQELALANSARIAIRAHMHRAADMMWDTPQPCWKGNHLVELELASNWLPSY